MSGTKIHRNAHDIKTSGTNHVQSHETVIILSHNFMTPHALRMITFHFPVSRPEPNISLWDLPIAIHTTEANLRQGLVEIATKRIEQFPVSKFQRARAPPRAPSKSKVPASSFPSAHRRRRGAPSKSDVPDSRFQIPGPHAPPQVHGSNSRISVFDGLPPAL